MGEYINILGCCLILFLLAAHWTPSAAQGDSDTAMMSENKFVQLGLYFVWLVASVGTTFIFIPMATLWIFIFENLFGKMETGEIGGSAGILSDIWNAYYLDTIPVDLNFFT